MTATSPVTPIGARLRRDDALLLVDVQADFVEGSLAVPGAAEIVPVLNRYVALFHACALPVFATRDWHPREHASFSENGGPWPQHCIAGTPGAAFANGLVMPRDTVVVSKGTVAEREAYSGFDGTELADRLRERGVRRVFVGGLATDYGVLATVRDARHHNFAVGLLVDGIRAIDAARGDRERAEAQMRRLGAVPVDFPHLHAEAVFSG